jgi:hypothetical protein
MSPAPVIVTIESEVTGLADGDQIARPVIRWVMVDMGAGKNDTCDEKRPWPLVRMWKPSKLPAARIPPHIGSRIPPPPVAEMEDFLTMGTATPFAAPFGAAKADREG